MKTNLKFFLCFLVFAFAASGSLFAQSLSTIATPTPAPAVQLTDDLTINLNPEYQVSAVYIADVSHYASNMPDQQAADAFMDKFERDYVTVEVDLAGLKALISLEMNATTSLWTVEQWNQHLQSN